MMAGIESRTPTRVGGAGDQTKLFDEKVLVEVDKRTRGPAISTTQASLLNKGIFGINVSTLPNKLDILILV